MDHAQRLPHACPPYFAIRVQQLNAAAQHFETPMRKVHGFNKPGKNRLNPGQKVISISVSNKRSRKGNVAL